MALHQINYLPMPLIFSPVQYRLLLFLRCERGLALAEFALALPLLLLLFYGTVELNRALLITQKVDKAIILTINIVTQYLSPGSAMEDGIKPLSVAELDNLMAWVPAMMDPTTPPFRKNGIIIITDVSTGTDASKPVINWQYCGGGTLAQKSKIGQGIPNDASPATLPAGFSMAANEEVVIGEIYYQYVPLIPSIVPFNIPPFYQISVFVPRYAPLNALVSANCP